MQQRKRELAMFLHPYEYEMLECQIIRDAKNGDYAWQHPVFRKGAGRGEAASLLVARWRRAVKAFRVTQGGRIAQVASRTDTSD
jgi:hypothetical protein